MKRRKEQPSAWVVDYSAARALAISWLGDRYLLARPINARRDTGRKAPPPVLQAMPPDVPAALASGSRH
jgi:hypothetical protein